MSSSNDQPVPKLKDLSIHGRSGLNPSIQAKLRAFQQQRQSQSQSQSQLNLQSSQSKNSPSSTFSSSPQQSNQLLQTIQTQLNQSAQMQHNNNNNNILNPQQLQQSHINSNRSFENIQLTNNSSQNSLPHINTDLNDIDNSNNKSIEIGIDDKNIESFNNNKPLPPLPPLPPTISSCASINNSSSTNTPMTANSISSSYPSTPLTPNQEHYLTANNSSNMDLSDSNYSIEDDNSTVVRRTSFRIPKSSTTPKSELDQDIMIKRSLSLERTLRQQQKFHNHHNISSGYTQNSLSSNVNSSTSTRPTSLPPLSHPKSNSSSEIAMHLNSNNSNTNLSSTPLSSSPVPPLTISPNIHAQIQAHLQSQIQNAAKTIDSDYSDSSASTPVNVQSPPLNPGTIPISQSTMESSNEQSSILNDNNNNDSKPSTTQSPIDSSAANSVTSSIGNIKNLATNSSLSSIRTISSHSSSDGSSPSTPTLKSPVLRSSASNNLQKKPSLSQRRGMKLDMKSLTGGNGGIDTDSPTTTATTAQGDIQQQSPRKSKQSPLSLKLNLNGLTTPVMGNASPINNNNNMNSASVGASPVDKFSMKLPNIDKKDDKLTSTMNRVKNSALPNRSNNSAMNGSLPSSNPGPISTVPGVAPTSSRVPTRPQGMFANFTKYIDVKSGSLNFAGKASLHSKGVDFSNGSSFRITLDDLEFQEELGRGNYGVVSKVLHKPTGIEMAMKEVRLELDDSKFRQILMELEVLHNCHSAYIIEFYGAFFIEGAVYMCIEYMGGGSLDKIYGDGIPEAQLAYVTNCVVRGLKELKDEHNIIHRDVKPTNILVNDAGKVKLCDFGVSGNLVASLARTNIGCQSYMAPERIKSLNPDAGTYSVQSDIWSLGLSILEIAKGCYPYPPETYNNVFSQLSAIVDGETPTLPPGKFSDEAQDFVAQCLIKSPNQRPVYAKLLNHPWLLKYSNMEEGQNLMCKYLKESKLNKIEKKKTNKIAPPLHKGGLGA
ncbi:hypothetical protein B5S29_g3342 [[Candida] boidinii]|nr:hypothetical protein B5S29_g3342 [[Candida] boidinii]